MPNTRLEEQTLNLQTALSESRSIQSFTNELIRKVVNLLKSETPSERDYNEKVLRTFLINSDFVDVEI